MIVPLDYVQRLIEAFPHWSDLHAALREHDLSAVGSLLNREAAPLRLFSASDVVKGIEAGGDDLQALLARAKRSLMFDEFISECRVLMAAIAPLCMTCGTNMKQATQGVFVCEGCGSVSGPMTG